MRPPFNSPRHRPPWWPENEAWPPMRRRRFSRRMGCFFFTFFSLSVLGGFSLLALALRGLGWEQVIPPLQPGNIFMLVALGALFLFGLMAGARFALRWMSRPLDGLLEAADQFAQGKPVTPVAESGPPELRSLTRSFNGMVARLQAEEQRRRGFLADVSHELRTPLTILRGTIEGFQDGLYTPDQARLEGLLDEIKLLDRLVDDLRILSLAESGALALRREPTDLTVLLGEAAEAFNSSGLRIQTDFPAHNLTLEIDPLRLRQVVDNLLSNAVRHTPPGGTIWLRCRALDGQVELQVEDSGPGIAPADLPHIFERFYKSGDSRGMGLGLSIARTLVEAHGGTINAQSPPGQGALILVRLPAP
jgi:signal transduction histidine kinase